MNVLELIVIHFCQPPTICYDEKDWLLLCML